MTSSYQTRFEILTLFSHQISNLFAIDLRSLKAFRIAIGVVLLIDLAIRATSLQAHYTDAGVMPSSLVAADYVGSWRWSLHFFSGSTSFQAILFVLSGLAAFCVAIGFHPRAAIALCWVLWTSMQARTPLLQTGADDLLRMLLFWAFFLPIPSRLSLGSRRTTAASSVSTIASAAIMLQVCVMYFFAGSWKLTGDWINGDELHRIFSDIDYARPLAYMLQGYPQLTSIAGTVVVFAEHILPILLLATAGYWRARCLVVAALASMHLGIEFTLTIGLFSLVCWSALLLFLPAGFWDYLGQFSKCSRFQETSSSDSMNSDTDSNGPPSQPAWWVQALAGTAVAFSLVYMIAWNLADRGAFGHNRIPVAAKRVGDLLSLQQNWRLFDYASNRGSWFIVLARLPDFNYADLLRGGVKADAETFTRPAYPYRRFPDHRWRKLYSHLVYDRNQQYRDSLCQYLATQWATHHSQRAEAIELQYMQDLYDPADPDAYMQRFLCILEIEDQPQK